MPTWAFRKLGGAYAPPSFQDTFAVSQVAVCISRHVEFPGFLSEEPEYFREFPGFLSEEPEYFPEFPGFLNEEPEYFPEFPGFLSEEPEYFGRNPEFPGFLSEEPEYFCRTAVRGNPNTFRGTRILFAEPEYFSRKPA